MRRSKEGVARKPNWQATFDCSASPEMIVAGGKG